jgi:hypothetical protein
MKSIIEKEGTEADIKSERDPNTTDHENSRIKKRASQSDTKSIPSIRYKMKYTEVKKPSFESEEDQEYN